MSKQAKKLRRIISVFLAAVMAVSCFSVSAAAACEESGAVGKAVSGDSVGAPAPEHPGIHFTDNQDWGFVYFYAWDENGDPLCGDWPGTAMEYEYHNDFGEAVYVAQIPADLAGFVFNSGFDGEQTENVTVDCYFKECYYYPSGEIDEYGHYIVCLYDITPIHYNIQLVNSRNWDDVYVYAWDKDGNALEGEWPGTKITSDSTDDFGSQKYTYFFRYSTKGVIFSNGKNEQTVEFTDIEKSYNSHVDKYVTNKTDESGHYVIGLLSDMDYHYGDVDCDGGITIGDATDISFHLAQFEGSEFSYLQKALADVNADGVVSIADVTSIQFVLAELDDNSRTDEICRLCDKGSNSLYLYSELDWENTYVYATDKEGNPLCGDWPGALLPQPSRNLGDIRVSLPFETERVVFSCGNKRTVEATKFKFTSNWYDMIIGDSQDENGNYSLEPHHYYQKDEEYEVRISNSQGWKNVNVYAWDKDGNALLGDWPGTAMNYIGDNDFGEGIYSATIPKEAVGKSFNSGADGDRTEDVYSYYFDEIYYINGSRDCFGHLIVYGWW